MAKTEEEKREYNRVKNRRYYKKNKIILAEKDKEYYRQNRERILKRMKKYKEENIDQIRERDRKQSKKYYKENRDKILKKQNQKPITEKGRAYNRKYFKDRYKNDPQFNIRMRLCVRFRSALGSYVITSKMPKSRNKNINYKAIIEHLKPFPADIGGYHIDHIIPLSFFDLTDSEQLKKAWLPINFQWLKCENNESKGNIIDFDKYPEQEAIFSEMGLNERFINYKDEDIL